MKSIGNDKADVRYLLTLVLSAEMATGCIPDVIEEVHRLSGWSFSRSPGSSHSWDFLQRGSDNLFIVKDTREILLKQSRALI